MTLARVGGTRVTLDTVVDAFKRGATAEEIAQQYPTVELSDVYSVLGYYLDQREEIEAYLGERSAKSEAIQIRDRIAVRPGWDSWSAVGQSQRLGRRQFDNLRAPSGVIRRT